MTTVSATCHHRVSRPPDRTPSEQKNHAESSVVMSGRASVAVEMNLACHNNRSDTTKRQRSPEIRATAVRFVLIDVFVIRLELQPAWKPRRGARRRGGWRGSARLYLGARR